MSRAVVVVAGLAGLAVAVVLLLRRAPAAPVAVAPEDDARAYIEEHDAEMRRLLEGLMP